MSNSATAADDLRTRRIAIGASQSRLARLSAVSRFKISTYELADGSLTVDEQNRIREVLQAEAERLRTVSIRIRFGIPQSSPAQEVNDD